jgi:hypothetical protein
MNRPCDKNWCAQTKGKEILDRSILYWEGLSTRFISDYVRKRIALF